MPQAKRRAPSPIGRLLKQWRSQRKLSQVALALEAGISSRHLAFIEVGRSTPSREMVLRLGAALELPLRERNLMLQAAGHAPEFPQTELGAPEMDQVRGALEFILAQHQPNPAALMDVNYDILMGNRPFDLALDFFVGGSGIEGPRRNFLRLLLDERGLGQAVVNAEGLLRRMIERVRRRVLHCPSDEAAQRLLEEAVAATPPEVHDSAFRIGEVPSILQPVHLRKGELEFRCFTVVTTLATVSDITLQELQIESYFPADSGSCRFMASLAAHEAH